MSCHFVARFWLLWYVVIFGDTILFVITFHNDVLKDFNSNSKIFIQYLNYFYIKNVLFLDFPYLNQQVSNFSFINQRSNWSL